MAKKNANKKGQKVIKKALDDLVGGQGISGVEAKRSEFEKKQLKENEIISKEEKKECLKRISEGITIRTSLRDFSLFFILQFVPLVLLGTACLIPGIIFILQEDWYALILLILAGLSYWYALARMVSSIVYKIVITSTEIRWRSLFKWNNIPNENISKIKTINGHYFYLTKIGGILRICVEAIKVTSLEKEHWIRSYPLGKKRGDELVKIVHCWKELSVERKQQSDG